MPPHPVDIHVGKQLASRRNLLGFSQKKIADCLNITFQQIQKYEKGINRISSSRLYELSNYLDTSVPYFFEGLPFDEVVVEKVHSNNHEPKDMVEIIQVYQSIKNANVRQHALKLIQSIARSYSQND